MSEIRIYFEGDTSLRPGFNELFRGLRELAREKKIGFTMIACHARAIQDFCIALTQHVNAFNVLLVDSDKADDGRLREELKRVSDWRVPTGIVVGDEQVHFMVQVMESWFLADREALAAYYGQGFRGNRLPQNPDIERIAKDDVLQGLRRATEGTKKGPYHKTRHAPEILRRLSFETIYGLSVSCKTFVDSIRQYIEYS